MQNFTHLSQIAVTITFNYHQIPKKTHSFNRQLGIGVVFQEKIFQKFNQDILSLYAIKFKISLISNCLLSSKLANTF